MYMYSLLPMLPFSNYKFQNITENVHYQLRTALAQHQLHTVMRIIKLKLFPVPLRLHSGSSKLKLCRYFIIFCDI